MRRFLAFAFFAVLIAEVMVMAPKQEGAIEPSLVANPSTKVLSENPEQQQVLEGVHLVETRDGAKEWELEAGDATSYRSAGNWILNKVRAKFFDEKGLESFIVTGKQGMVTPNTKDLKITGSVVVEAAGGYEMKTETVSYRAEKQMLEGADPVEMQDTQESKAHRLFVKGLGFNAFVKEKFIDILSDVSVRKGLKDGRLVVVHSERARFNGLDRSANFSGEVGIDVGAQRVTGPEARFIYDAKKETITSLEVAGGIRLTDLDKWATAQKFTMSFAHDKYVLSGSPRLVQDSDELHGDVITLYDGGKRIQVRSAKAAVDSSREGNGR